MKTKQSVESKNFDDVVDKLLSVPYSELKKKLDEEKAKKKKPVKTSSSDRVSRKKT